MPQLIRTPEQIFREERCDVYYLYFNQDDLVGRATRDEMQTWFQQHMPNSPVEAMGPSEYSGWICGGPAMLRIAFTDADLKKFCEVWETPDGTSIDPRFQCYLSPYQNWWDKHGQYVPTLAQPSHAGISSWIQTPLGTLNHVLPPDGRLKHPANVRDLWANACQQWPELAKLNLDDLNHGHVAYAAETNKWYLSWNAPFSHHECPPPQHWRALADWLRLPADTDIGSEW